MNQTVLGEIYESLQAEELKSLDQYIATSRWEYSETIVLCHGCMAEYTRTQHLHELNKEILFSAIYGDETYNDTKLRYVLNRLLEAIREYQIVAEFKKENVFAKKVWMDFMIEKKLKKNLLYNLGQEEISSISDYRFLYQYFKSQEDNFYRFHFTKDVKEQYESIIAIMNHAERFSDLVFLKNYCSLITFTNVYQSIPFALPQKKLEDIQQKNWGELHYEFAVYLRLIDLLTIKSTDGYYRFKETLFQNFEVWDEDEKVNFLAYLLNYTTNAINKGMTEFIQEQYNLFRYFEEKGYFLLRGYINSGRINNVVHIYLRMGKYELAEDFVKKYILLLNVSDRESCLHFNMARILFEKSQYKLSLRELLRVEYGHDSFYSFNSKLLLLKNYYELQETDAFDSLCSSFKEFTRKNKMLSNDYKSFYLNFIKMTKKLYQATPTKKKKLEKEILENAQIAEKNWLLEKSHILAVKNIKK